MNHIKGSKMHALTSTKYGFIVSIRSINLNLTGDALREAVVEMQFG